MLIATLYGAGLPSYGTESMDSFTSHIAIMDAPLYAPAPGGV